MNDPQPAPPPAPLPQIETVNQRAARHVTAEPNHGPRRYPALRIVQVAFYALAVLAAGQWVLFGIFTAITVANAGGTDLPQWPAGVPAGASVFDPDLNATQRALLQAYEREHAAAAAAPVAASASLMMLLANLVGTAVACCLSIAAGELIRVLLDVQDDTRRAAVYASRLPVVPV